MRSVNFLKVACDAELLRLRARGRQRAAFAFVALVFALAVLALAEVTDGWACG